jgi:hypothetical protein
MWVFPKLVSQSFRITKTVKKDAGLEVENLMGIRHLLAAYCTAILIFYITFNCLFFAVIKGTSQTKLIDSFLVWSPK